MESLADAWRLDVLSAGFAEKLDQEDPLRKFRAEYHIPSLADLPGTDAAVCPDMAEDSIYFAGNSLGLQPRRVGAELAQELSRWAKMGVHAHRHGERAVESADLVTSVPVAELVGASPEEVSVMTTLTTNLHLLLLAFYRPTKERFKILCEAQPFPSDFYVFESQVRLRGLAPEEAIIGVAPRYGESCVRPEDLLGAIAAHGPQLAVICLPGVQFYTGQLFDIAAITAAGHRAGAVVGWDLAHAIGNVELALHDWGVDFAAWCHYKYVCGGAGAVGGAFVHAKHNGSVTPVLHGWWGHDIASRFEMTNRMVLTPGARGFRLSCPSALSLAPVRVGAQLLLQAGMAELRGKSLRLTGYLELLLRRKFTGKGGRADVELITPAEPERRGAQLSLKFTGDVASVHRELLRRGVSCDVRKPGVIRVAPKPIYNSFRDVFRFVLALEDILRVPNGFTEAH